VSAPDSDRTSTAVGLLELGMRKLPRDLPPIVTPVVQAAFDGAVANAPDPEARAKAELLRAYYCVPGFAGVLADALWELEQRKNAQATSTDQGRG
jgi:hypothetical protein